ncbi:hypothetical protein VUR80DRAFT_530 [Thermomyces stellatus]
MGWAEHLRGKDMGTLRELSKQPPTRAQLARIWSRAEREWAQVLRAVTEGLDRVVARCAGRLGRVPRETRRWINGVSPTEPARRPLGLKEHESSMERYRGYWKRYLCYCVRACRAGRDEAREQQGVVFTDKQGTRRRVTQARTRTWVRTGRQAAVDRAVYEFCIASIKQKVVVDEYTNPLLHFTAVLAIDRTGTAWKGANEFTGQLAGLVWCARMLMLEHFFEDTPEEAGALTAEMVEAGEDEYRRWLADGTHTPMSTMVSWMTYGKVVRLKEGRFREAAAASIDEAETLLEGLMFGNWAGGGRWREKVELGRIVDSLLYEGPGRSFATNERNRGAAGGGSGRRRASICRGWRRSGRRWWCACTCGEGSRGGGRR